MTARPEFGDAIAELRKLIAKATQDDLSDDGRYFHESCSDLTQCRHSEIGEYQNSHDGKLVEWLWNRRNEILSLYTSTALPLAHPAAKDMAPADRDLAAEIIESVLLDRAGGADIRRAAAIIARHRLAHPAAPQGEEERLREALRKVKQAARYVAVGDGYFDPYASHIEAVDAIVDAALAHAAIASEREGAEPMWTGADCPRCDGERVIHVDDRPYPNDISPSTHQEPCPECTA